ncbi:MAG: hypothetical protein WBQ66_19180 [Blastocatellia bacterium]
MGGTKRDDFGSTLQSMTMRHWIERVCQLQNTVEHRDRVIAKQRKTIASQLAIIERLRVRVEKIDPEPTNPDMNAAAPPPVGRAPGSTRKPRK